MIILTRKINVDTNTAREEQYVAVINITPKIQQQMELAYMSNGTVTVFLPGTTAGVGTIEFEEGLIADFKNMWARVVPREIVYRHKFLWEENNGFSVCRCKSCEASCRF